MKSLIRWTVALGIACGTFFGVPGVNTVDVLALTEEEVEEKLRRVPVFVIMTSEGNPLIRRSLAEEEEDVRVTDIYFSGQDAQQVINELQNLTPRNPDDTEEVEQTGRLVEFAQALKVRPFPLALIYQELRDNAEDPERIRFVFNPTLQDVTAARNLLEDPEEELPGVPLFMIKLSENQGYASIIPPGKSEDESILPAFFSQSEALNFLTQVQEQDPGAAIQVVDIASIILTMLNSDEPWLDRVELIAPQEALQDARSLTPSTPSP